MSSEFDAGVRLRRYGTWAIAGIILYVILDIVAQLLPPHYSPIHQAESDLAVGPYGFIMRLNFLVRAALSLLVVSALATALRQARSRWALVLFSIWGITSGLLAFFNTDILDDPKLDPVLHRTWHGDLHLALALFGFIAAPLGAILIARAFSRVAAFRAAGRASMVWAVVSLVALLAMRPLATHQAGGLGERIFLATVLIWTGHAAVSLRWAASRQADSTAAQRPVDA